MAVRGGPEVGIEGQRHLRARWLSLVADTGKSRALSVKSIVVVNAQHSVETRGAPSWWRRAGTRIVGYFAGPPTFEAALPAALLVATLLFVRNPASNFIFDEQEALLANPFVNGKAPLWKAFQCDFWGLGPERSIGSYRPIPNLVWRILWQVRDVSWLPHWVNVVVHALNAALLAIFTWWLTRERRSAWLAAAIFVTLASLTEAVSGVVGIADVLGGLGLLLALTSLKLKAPAMTGAVFLAVLFGLFSKESVIVAPVLLPLAALISAPLLHPDRPRRALRAALAGVAALAALAVYTEVRRRLFPVSGTVVANLSNSQLPSMERALKLFLAWFRQPRLPHDPMNNPLVDADFAHRLAGSLRVYWRGLSQSLVPRHLSGDYSFPQEPIPERLLFPESILGALAFLLPLAFGLGLLIFCVSAELQARRHAKSELARSAPGLFAATPQPFRPSTGLALTATAALGLLWWPLAYFPHSNALVLLPTVRAERFWYLPALGLAWSLSAAASALFERSQGFWRRALGVTLGAFFALQVVQARRHAFDYNDDLAFWRATKNAAPRSAKAHLNYSVMVGARGDLLERLSSNARALELAPEWPMANVYYADTLCRLHRSDEAWPYYRRGFELGPNESHLIALGLQCLWDEGGIQDRHDELLDLADAHPSSWLAYLARTIVDKGDEHHGVEEKYRPRAYNAGPKE